MAKKVGIIGCGAIGRALVGYIFEKLHRYVGGVSVWDIDKDAMRDINTFFDERLSCCDGMEDVISRSDIVVEAASPVIVPDILSSVISAGKDVVIMSIGGVIGKERLLDRSREAGIRIFLPSGAVAGIDAIRSAKASGLDNVTITTRKPPGSLKGAPYLERKGIDVDSIRGETVIFEGTAGEAIKAFPRNINVSALLSLAGIGPEKTLVRIISSSDFTSNSHEITARGASGTITARTENMPFPENPKTSYLAALAAMETLRGYFDTVRIGT